MIVKVLIEAEDLWQLKSSLDDVWNSILSNFDKKDKEFMHSEGNWKVSALRDEKVIK